MGTRTPAVASYFYPSSEQECRAEIESCLDQARRQAEQESATETRAALAAGTERAIGGIVPHAGWVCSGMVAAEVLRELTRRPGIDTFVVFGAAHRLASSTAALYGQGSWSSPLGETAIDEDLASAVLTACSSVREDEEPHLVEHSIEVQLPFLQYLAPTARLLPILVPHTAPGPVIGRAVAEQARLLSREVIFVGSTDLTHYGPRYHFTPQGVGEAGLRWAKQVNDRQIIDLICRMQADEVAPQARRHHNACGAGAVAAAIAACRQQGATRGLLLRHTTSNETLRSRFGPMEDAVGYAGIVFTAPLAS